MGENGILNRATDASKKTKFASEKEAIEFIMSDIKTGKMIGEKIPDNKYVGTALAKRSIGHTTDWGVVTVNGTNYADGWYLLEEGNEITGYGKATESWLINYDTGETIQLEKDGYSKVLSNEQEDNKVAKENLIFDLDAELIDLAKNEDGTVTEESFKNVLDSNTELVNFNWSDPNSGVTKSSFKLDGVDDYIKVKYDSQKQKDFLINNGFTFEFYGILDGGTSRKLDGTVWNYSYKGLFGYWNGDESTHAYLRFGIHNYGDTIFWNALPSSEYHSDLSEPHAWGGESWWNQAYVNSFSFYDNKPHYITVTLDTSESFEKEIDGNIENCYKQTIYVDGKKEIEAGYNVLSWKEFKDNGIPYVSYFCVGRCSLGDTIAWHYSKMDCYALRLYSRGLSEKEVEKSYSDTKAYHEMLEGEAE